MGSRCTQWGSSAVPTLSQPSTQFFPLTLNHGGLAGPGEAARARLTPVPDPWKSQSDGRQTVDQIRANDNAVSGYSSNLAGGGAMGRGRGPQERPLRQTGLVEAVEPGPWFHLPPTV